MKSGTDFVNVDKSIIGQGGFSTIQQVELKNNTIINRIGNNQAVIKLFTSKCYDTEFS